MRGGWLLISSSIALSIYAGFPETAFINGLLALLWAVVRVMRAPSEARSLLVRKICIAGVVGILVTAPLVIPFFEYLQHSGIAHDDFADSGLPKSSFLQLFLPYVYGPIEGLIGADSKNELLVDWGNIGGYFGVAAIFFAILGAITERRERLLCVVLAIWTFILVSRTISVPGTNALFSLIPGMKFVAIFRNSSASFEMATAILAAFALDNWHNNLDWSRRKVWCAAAAVCVLIAIAFGYGTDMIGRLRSSSHAEWRWLWYSIGLGGGSLVSVSLLCIARPTKLRSAMLGGVVIAECAFLYSIPQLSGLRGSALDPSPMTFLRNNLGQQRAYALGGIRPNYGSYYGAAFINHESLPVSDAWVSYVRRNLDPKIDSVSFLGDFPEPFSDRQMFLRRNQKNFENAGVRFVTVPKGVDPFEDSVTAPHSVTENVPIYLNEGGQISGLIATFRSAPEAIQNASVNVGTDGGAATGRLTLKLCSGDSCVEANSDVANAVDNQGLKFRFASPLTVEKDKPLRYTITHVQSTHPVAIWMYPASSQMDSSVLPGNVKSGRIPDLSVLTPSGVENVKWVFRGQTQDIYELPNPAPYFQITAGACGLKVASRLLVEASCSTEATLVRRELYYPGWRAFVNGTRATVRANSIFQEISLPKGESNIDFVYEPSNIGWIYLSSVIGVCMLITSRRLV